MGGRPSHPIKSRTGTWNPAYFEEHTFVFSHWSIEWRSTEEDLNRWKAFREHQQRQRKSSEVFQAYKTRVQDYCTHEDLPHNPDLEQDQARQDKLVDWKEYYIYEHRHFHNVKLRVERHGKRLEDARQPSEPRFDVKNATYDHFYRARGELKDRELLVEWIDAQIAAIAAEIGDAPPPKRNSSSARVGKEAKRQTPAATATSTSTQKTVAFDTSIEPPATTRILDSNTAGPTLVALKRGRKADASARRSQSAKPGSRLRCSARIASMQREKGKPKYT